MLLARLLLHHCQKPYLQTKCLLFSKNRARKRLLALASTALLKWYLQSSFLPHLGYILCLVISESAWKDNVWSCLELETLCKYSKTKAGCLGSLSYLVDWLAVDHPALLKCSGMRVVVCTDPKLLWVSMKFQKRIAWGTRQQSLFFLSAIAGL